jgi:hypothetical protein
MEQLRARASREEDIEEIVSEFGGMPFPFVLFFDSLKAHRKTMVSSKVSS